MHEFTLWRVNAAGAHSRVRIFDIHTSMGEAKSFTRSLALLAGGRYVLCDGDDIIFEEGAL